MTVFKQDSFDIYTSESVEIIMADLLDETTRIDN